MKLRPKRKYVILAYRILGKTEVISGGKKFKKRLHVNDDKREYERSFPGVQKCSI